LNDKWTAIVTFVLPIYVCVMFVLLHMAGLRQSKVLKSFHRKFLGLSLMTVFQDPEDYAEFFVGVPIPPEEVRRHVKNRIVAVRLALILFNAFIIWIILAS
jgi:hypothetical protein